MSQQRTRQRVRSRKLSPVQVAADHPTAVNDRTSVTTTPPSVSARTHAAAVAPVVTTSSNSATGVSDGTDGGAPSGLTSCPPSMVGIPLVRGSPGCLACGFLLRGPDGAEVCTGWEGESRVPVVCGRVHEPPGGPRPPRPGDAISFARRLAEAQLSRGRRGRRRRWRARGAARPRLTRWRSTARPRRRPRSPCWARR
jgi:hypothetical protein